MASKSFSATFDCISRLQHITIPESQTGGQREVSVRYKRNYAIENNEWGDFQAHRKVLGLICIGKCGVQDELVSLCEEHEKIREKYVMMLFDSHCVMFGNGGGGSQAASAQQSPADEKKLVNGGGISSQKPGIPSDQCFSLSLHDCDTSDTNVDRDSGVYDTKNADSQAVLGSVTSPSDHSSSSTLTTNSPKSEASLDSSSRSSKPFFPPQNLKTTVLYYENQQDSGHLEQDLYDFICSLFRVLEFKRLDCSQEKVDPIPLLCAPFEKKYFVAHDMDSRSKKKHRVARMKKHIGDLAVSIGRSPCRVYKLLQCGV